MVDPDEYPADCTIAADELTELKDTLTDDANSDWPSYVEDWPPSDANDNVYDIWFTLNDLNGEGYLVDSDGRTYDPFAGNLTPRSIDSGEFCNTPLSKWRDRYPNIRFCGIYIDERVDYDTFCKLHQGRKNTMKTAEEITQTGFYHKTLDHLYAKLTPWQRLFGHGVYESLLGQSNYDFAVEYQEDTFDFSEEDFRPPDCGEDGHLEVKCGYPTQHLDASLSLFAAAMMGVQMISVQPKIMEEDRENGEDMMESKTIETAQLTAPPSEHDPSPQQYKTLETWSEHHLNLPLSRLVNDRKKLLKMGGVSTDPEETSDDIGDADIVVNLEAEGDEIDTTDDTGTDPNHYAVDGEVESQSQQIVDNINDE